MNSLSNDLELKSDIHLKKKKVSSKVYLKSLIKER